MSIFLKGNVQVSFEDTKTAFGHRSNADLQQMQWLFSAMNNKFLVSSGTSVIRGALKMGLPVGFVLEKTLFKQFCGGQNIEKSLPTINELAKSGVKSILDYSVEGEQNNESFIHTFEEIARTIDFAADNEDIPFSVFKVSGICNSRLLIKKQADNLLTDTEQQQLNEGKERFMKLCRQAYHRQVRLLVDAEETWMQETIDDWTHEAMALYNQERAVVFRTFQMYLKKSLPNLKKSLHFAIRKNCIVGVKLVRGAYMEKERERAHDLGYDSPIQDTKQDSDNDFNKAIMFLLNEKQRYEAVIGTHNEYSTYYAMEAMNRHSILPADTKFWFSQLYGMSDHISYNLAAHGYNVAKYVPYGPVEAVMPYLFRRAEENTSVAGQTSRELKLIRKELERRRLQD